MHLCPVRFWTLKSNPLMPAVPASRITFLPHWETQPLTPWMPVAQDLWIINLPFQNRQSAVTRQRYFHMPCTIKATNTSKMMTLIAKMRTFPPQMKTQAPIERGASTQGLPSSRPNYYRSAVWLPDNNLTALPCSKGKRQTQMGAMAAMEFQLQSTVNKCWHRLHSTSYSKEWWSRDENLMTLSGHLRSTNSLSCSCQLHLSKLRAFLEVKLPLHLNQRQHTAMVKAVAAFCTRFWTHVSDIRNRLILYCVYPSNKSKMVVMLKTRM